MRELAFTKVSQLAYREKSENQVMNEKMTSMREGNGHALSLPGWSVVDCQNEFDRSEHHKCGMDSA